MRTGTLFVSTGSFVISLRTNHWQQLWVPRWQTKFCSSLLLFLLEFFLFTSRLKFCLRIDILYSRKYSWIFKNRGSAMGQQRLDMNQQRLDFWKRKIHIPRRSLSSIIKVPMQNNCQGLDSLINIINYSRRYTFAFPGVVMLFNAGKHITKNRR